MRVAVCLSGQARFIRANFNSIYDNLIAPVDADVFFHHWDTEDSKLDMFPQEAPELYKPKKYIIEPQKVWDESQWDDVVSIVDTGETEERYKWKLRRVHSMLYSIFTANSLRKQHEEENGFVYDCIIRTRTDLWFGSPFSIDEFNQNPASLWVWFVRDRGPHRIACCDLFAFGNSHTMDLYSEFYNHVIEQVYKTKHLFIEALLLEYLNDIEMPIKFSKTLKSKHDRKMMLEWKFSTGDDRVPDHPILQRA